MNLIDLDELALELQAIKAESIGWQPLGDVQDGRILSTDVAGGFVGATLGPYVRWAKPSGEGE